MNFIHAEYAIHRRSKASKDGVNRILNNVGLCLWRKFKDVY